MPHKYGNFLGDIRYHEPMKHVWVNPKRTLASCKFEHTDAIRRQTSYIKTTAKMQTSLCYGSGQNLASRNVLSKFSIWTKPKTKTPIWLVNSRTDSAPIPKTMHPYHVQVRRCIILLIYSLWFSPLLLLTLNTFWSCICSSAESLGKSVLFLHNIWYPRVILRQEKIPMKKSADISIEFVSFRTEF